MTSIVIMEIFLHPDTDSCLVSSIYSFACPRCWQCGFYCTTACSPTPIHNNTSTVHCPCWFKIKQGERSFMRNTTTVSPLKRREFFTNLLPEALFTYPPFSSGSFSLINPFHIISCIHIAVHPSSPYSPPLLVLCPAGFDSWPYIPPLNGPGMLS